jgi:hypothetical protein
MRGARGKNKPVANELQSAGAAIVEIDFTDDAGVNRGKQAAIETAGGLGVMVDNVGLRPLAVGNQTHDG